MDKWVVLGFIVAVLFGMACYGIMGYVAYHFITKFW